MPGGYDDDNRSISSHDGVYMGGSGNNNNQGMMFNDAGGGGGGGNNNGMGNHHELSMMRLEAQGQGLGQGQGQGQGSDFMTTPTSPSLNSMNPDNPYSSMHDSKIKFSHTISHINPTAAAGNNRMLCSVDSLPVEIIPNSRSDLCFLGFLEEISQVMIDSKKLANTPSFPPPSIVSLSPFSFPFFSHVFSLHYPAFSYLSLSPPPLLPPPIRWWGKTYCSSDR